MHLFYKNKNVFVTGHTGFKGSWLCEWLLMMGANVTGYALDPLAHEVLYDQLALSSRVKDHRGDLADRMRLQKIIAEEKPEIIFHLAAQPLVRLSYEIPVETFATNVMGTAHLLEAVRLSNHRCTVVAVTTDKCYENKEWLHAYRENDPMGGHDPYSASKGAAEIVIASYQRSFFHEKSNVRLASARAGNVIGGGDWAIDRIVPDCFRAIFSNKTIEVRNKIATRPWQHVLEPLSGYLTLAAALHQAKEPSLLASGFNFGPEVTSNKTVKDLVEEILKHADGSWLDCSDPNALHEASKLSLAIDKAFHLLDWRPVWDFPTTIQKTTDWYVKTHQSENQLAYTRQQITEYQNDAQTKKIAWAI